MGRQPIWSGQKGSRSKRESLTDVYHKSSTNDPVFNLKTFFIALHFSNLTQVLISAEA